MPRTSERSKATRTELLQTLLRARAGASVDRLCEATGWQPHSVRAALSRLRKQGHRIERRAPAKPGGEARYRITSSKQDAQ